VLGPLSTPIHFLTLPYCQSKLGYEELSEEELVDLMKTIAGSSFCDLNLFVWLSSAGGPEKSPTGVDFKRGINEQGFLTMIHLFIQKGQLKFIWDALSHFGYDVDLNLDESLRKPDLRTPNQLLLLAFAMFKIPLLVVVKDYKPELSQQAISFLLDLFACVGCYPAYLKLS